jgi:hypothetical protein
MATSELRPLERDLPPERLQDYIAGPRNPHHLVSRAMDEQIARGMETAIDDLQGLAVLARQHKRLANAHRRRAALVWASFEEFKSKLESLGIQVVIETSIELPMPEGGTSDRSDRRDRRDAS